MQHKEKVKTVDFSVEEIEILQKKAALADSLKFELNDYKAKARLIKGLRCELEKERIKLHRITNSLAYYVGDSFVSALGKGGLFLARLPIAMLFTIKGVLAYRRAQNALVNNEYEVRELDVISLRGITSARIKYRNYWPKPNASRSDLAFLSMGVLREYGVDEAVDFFDFYLTGENLAAGWLLSLNLYLNDEEKWLGNINNYLESFGLLPISLSSRAPSKSGEFQRIECLVPGDYTVDSSCKVTIIMPAFNAEKTVEHAIKSILAQTWRDFELIIVDDCSSDQTWEIVKAYSAVDDRIVALRNHVNVGPYVSKNYALRIAQGKYLTGHDADDWAHPQRIENQMRVMLGAGDVNASITRMIRMNERRGVDHFSRIGKVSPDGVARLASISCMFEMNSFREKLGYWDSVRFGGDSELIQRAKIIFGDKFVTQETISMICLDAEGSLTNHPVHGIDKVAGISSSRIKYKDAWKGWHKTISEDSAYLDFPQVERKFEAPCAASVSDELINTNLTVYDHR
ncbi:glycosyltransferase family 2 protein [Microbulbifer echini]|uniref:Glycosyltransferase family 2 protein n=1 Tax=Microbulbifer echini TaxID=1529067 RepID=A0ABV4NS45_9GAMM